MKCIKDACVFIIFVMLRTRLDEALAYSKKAYPPSKLDEALAFSSFASMNPEVYPVEQETDISKDNTTLEVVIKPKKVLGPITTRAQWH